MIRLATLIKLFAVDFLAQYRDRLRPEHRQAMAAIKRCRTASSLTMQVQCTACPHQRVVPHSCGHRYCPTCQKRLIALLQVVLQFDPGRAPAWVRTRAPMLCACCGAVMTIVKTRLRSPPGGTPAPIVVAPGR